MFYSISDLARFSGVKAHTIRIWEQRYNILSPHRTQTNIRYYDDDQLHKLLNVSSLVRAGQRISKISKLSDDEIIEAIKELEGVDSTEEMRYEHSRNALMASALQLDEHAFDRALSHSISRFGMQDAYVNVIGPMLNKTGLMWRQKRMDPSQEHFASCLVKQKLYVAIDGLPIPRGDDRPWILFLPEQEEHEIGLLFAHFLLREAGIKALYLGSRVPMGSLKSAMKDVDPAYLMTFITSMMQVEESQAFLSELARAAGNRTIYVAGPPYLLKELRGEGDMVFLDSVDALTDLLQQQKLPRSA